MKAGLRGIQVQPVTRGPRREKRNRGQKRLIRPFCQARPRGIHLPTRRLDQEWWSPGGAWVSQSVACRGTQGHSVRTIGTARNFSGLTVREKGVRWSVSDLFLGAPVSDRPIVRFRSRLPVRGCQPSAARNQENFTPAKRKGTGRGIIEAP
jgi:hypothetical protein